MDSQSAVVISRATLAKMEKCSEATIKRAVATLRQGSWIETVQVGGKGGVNAYVVNSRVAWADKRERLTGAIFTATVIASSSEQDNIETTPLRRIAALYPNERQLPAGDGLSPPTQPELSGLESDPPALLLKRPVDEVIDQDTGEITKAVLIKKLRDV